MPEITRVAAPLEVLEAPAAAPVLVAVVTTPLLPVETTTDTEAEGAFVGAGRAVKRSVLAWVTQLDDAGTRGV